MWRHMCMTRQCVGYSEWIHWNENVDILTKFSVSSPTALEFVILTTSNAASDENFRHYRFRVRVKKLWQLLRVSTFISPILAIAKYVSILVLSNSYPIKKKAIEKCLCASSECHNSCWSVNIGSGNGLVPSDNKRSPEPMLTQINVFVWRH